MNIISDEKILIIAYNNIKSNVGATTLSVDDITADHTSIKTIRTISKQLKNNTFKWGKIKQIHVPKPGKGITRWTKKKLIQFGRPIGIPNFHSKIVQEAIRIVLSAIYEPIFDKLECSFGFRPNKSALDAINKIENESQGMELTLEGDIEKAFNSMDHDILIKKLSKRISDKKFLKLVLDCCRTGIFHHLTKAEELPELGSPQGAILSPILWNIYMTDFDEYIINEIQNLVETINKKQIITKANPKDKRTKDLYRYTTTEPTGSNYYKIITKKALNLNKQIIPITHRTPLNRLSVNKQKIATPLLKEYSNLNKIIYKTSSTNMARIKIRITYVRYADDFIIITNANETILKYIKNKLRSFLHYDLKLSLSPQKTTITNIKLNPAKFLGFTIFKIKNQLVKYVEPHIKKRVTGSKLSIGIDYTRIIKRFIEKRHINKNRKITSIGELTKKENVEILNRFNEIIRGYAIYYLPLITSRSYFNYILYVLEYSFYKTLCHKNKTSINKLFKRFGDPITIELPNLTDPLKTKHIELITGKNIEIKIGETIKTIKNNIFNKTPQEKKITETFINYRKGFWRTNSSMSSACINCGSWLDIEYHHIKKLGSDRKKYKYAFEYNIRALNRKAIPLCSCCHLLVHNGKLDNIHISQLYDTRLANYQNHIKIKMNDQQKEN